MTDSEAWFGGVMSWHRINKQKVYTEFPGEVTQLYQSLRPCRLGCGRKAVSGQEVRENTRDKNLRRGQETDL